MFNVLSRYLAIASLGILLFACSDKEAKQAQMLLEQAQLQYENGQYAAAMELLDSIDTAYPAQVDIRREAMHLKPQIIEKESLLQLQSTDSIIALLTIESENLRESLKHVDDGFEGYYTTKKLAGKIPAEKEGIYARMSPDGVYTIVSSAKKGTESNAVKLSSGTDEAVSGTVEYDGERNDRSRGPEIITFMPNECNMLGEFAVQHVGEPLQVTFIGKKNYTIKLDKDQAEAVSELYTASDVFSRLRSAQLEKTRLERQIDIARSQAARTYREKEDK